ncbi:uncharacterized protein LOC126737934 [Anthonomus grandis grandis]|uniref:uncharacterized protein LOC126737934 n=1 Tax=Anthonomus grandis grandis TaxID=2921223 RepID=UPI0021669601|nr:uncharacterized protein LOC126737934 [Anthonomus grandis grandis]XP_050298996.1 uncharacterized protein LOC126737934 [Anthonomus grandis grandis]
MDQNLLLNKPTRKWVHEFNEDHRQSEYYLTCLPMRGYPDKFKKYHRMTVETFDYILSHIKGDIQKWSNFRNCIEPAKKLSILLRYLSTGLSFEALSETFRMNNYKIVEETADAIWNQLAPIHLPVPNRERFLEIAAEFKDMWNFPNCAGCIDGKHVKIKATLKSGTMFYNYKHFFSVNLHGVADARCKLIFIDVGAFGKQSDGGVFEASRISTFFENCSETLPALSPIDDSDTLVPFVLVGDDAYPLKTFLMKPFSQRKMTEEQRVFNYRLSRCRRCIECAFGILTAKWRLLYKVIETEVEKAEKIIKCMCLLHNLIIDKENITLNQRVLEDALQEYQ